MARSYAPISPKALLKKPIGGTPDYELVLIPGWLIFSAEDGYAKPQYAHFMIQNSENLYRCCQLTIASYALEFVKKDDELQGMKWDRSFPQFSHCHGYLPPKGSDEITILITAREHWPRDVSEFAAKRHKVLIEHLTVPPYTTPPKNAYVSLFYRSEDVNFQQEAAAELARIIFKMTPSLTRMYCKLNIILPKLADDRGTSDRPTSLSGEILTGSK
ncbi:unnamed protein product [Toxocara canis]|uniref:Terpenoid synthase n=1 Tax=Toxocara canis TaxID=6265 RepID=A0A183TV77_TOXCA|nr:unnamed protein product [Toxocara canis]